MAFEQSDALALMAQRRFVPFHYNHDEQLFHFGEHSRTLEEIPVHGTLHQAGRELTADDTQRLISCVAFASSFNKIHTLPLADVFFERAWSSDVVRETNEIMHDVYETARAVRPSDRGTSGRSSRHEFSTILYDRADDPSGHAGVFLQAAGICACCKPGMHTDASFYPIDVMTYGEHNVGTFPEKASILAGLGNIARRANEYVR